MRRVGGEKLGPRWQKKEKKLKCTENNVERGSVGGRMCGGGEGTKGIKHFRKIKDSGEEEGPVATSHNNKDVSE